MIRIDVQSNLKEFQQKLDSFARQQLPFATARALTTLAGMVRDEERVSMGSVFDRPTPFTINSVGVKPAKKTDLTAIVFVKDIAASYLQPYETGGVNKLTGNVFLRPGGVGLNKYGNLPRNKIAQLKSRKDVFIGPVKFKSGSVINGVWQRNPEQRGKRTKGDGRYGTKGAHSKQLAAQGIRTTLKLLVKFEDAHPIRQRLGFHNKAQQVVRQRFDAEMRKALAAAIATAGLK